MIACGLYAIRANARIDRGSRSMSARGERMTRSNRQIAEAFFAALSAGSLPDDLVTEDLTAWTTTSGSMPGERYRGGVKLLQSLFPAGLAYTVDSLTAEEDRVAAEVQSRGTLSTGEDFHNIYVFLLRIRDGRVASVAEHFNPGVVREKIAPLMQAAMAKPAG
jgi:ketosteroid isomerase-like protein